MRINYGNETNRLCFNQYKIQYYILNRFNIFLSLFLILFSKFCCFVRQLYRQCNNYYPLQKQFLKIYQKGGSEFGILAILIFFNFGTDEIKPSKNLDITYDIIRKSQDIYDYQFKQPFILKFIKNFICFRQQMAQNSSTIKTDRKTNFLKNEIIYLMQKATKKINSFTQTPNYKQILSYILFIIVIIGFTLAVPFNIQFPMIIPILTGFYTFTIAVFITTFICSFIDPSDILQNNKTCLYCVQCNLFVQPKSKHCRSCDRCTQQFDHHCKWINNCVGIKNYRWFVAMIVSQLFQMGFYLFGCIYLIIQQRYNGVIIAMWIIGVPVLAMFIFMINLIGFHIYLWMKGLTTFQFISQTKIVQQPNYNLKLQRRTNKKKQVKQKQLEQTFQNLNQAQK